MRRTKSCPPRTGLVCAAVLGLLVGGCGDDSTSEQDDDSDSDSADDGDEADDDDDDDDDDSDDDDDDDDDDGDIEYLDPVDHLVRISMALRGARPSVADIEAVEADPDALPGIVDEYLETGAFGEVIRDLHNDALLVAAENMLPSLPPLDDHLGITINESAMRTPLRLAEYIVMENRPYTELVTADYMLVDEIAAQVWGKDYDGNGGWEVIPVDDRPAAGILADTSFFVRHQSAGANYNRGRANAISSALLCHDFNSLDIDVGAIDLSDPDAVNNAVVNVPECAACHVSLDPLASSFFGHYPTLPNAMQIGQYPLPSAYLAGTEDAWQQTNEREPAYFGEPTDGLDHLGQQIAEDPRFAQCAAIRFYEYFHQHDDIPLERITELQDSLTDSGFDAKAMVRDIVLHDDFRAAAGITDDAAETLVGVKKARPFQLGRLMRDLTGFRWELDLSLVPELGAIGVIDLTRNATIGFNVLGGAGDSFSTTEVADTVNATTSLFLRQLATESASFVVEQDFGESDPDERALLTLVEPGDTDESAVREQLAWLFLRLYAQRVDTDSSEVDDIYAVFEGVRQATDDTEHAWKATLTAMLQDSAILFY